METPLDPFEPIDHELMRVRGQLSPGARLQAMLAAREWVVSAMRSRMRRRYPDLSPEHEAAASTASAQNLHGSDRQSWPGAAAMVLFAAFVLRGLRAS